MTRYEETTTVGGYTNNITLKRITKEDTGEIVANYCILDINDEVATIMESNVVTQVSVLDNPQRELLEVFNNPPKTAEKKATKKDKK